MLSRQGSTLPEMSLVIPAYNEELLLPHLLDSVDQARRCYRRGPDAVEVIVADNASTDGTARVAIERGCKLARVERRAIASARNGGAREARGRILCFVDADSVIHPDTFNAVEAALDDPRIVGGASGITLERRSAAIAATWLFLALFLWLTGMDSGVAFCRAADFEALGGFDENRLYAEDADFLWRLRRLGRTRGQSLTRLPRARVIPSMRKFDERGDWHFLALLFRAAYWHFFRPEVAERVARDYWYDVREPDAARDRAA